MATPSPARLDGWKAIAEYLGRDARTLQRWRDERGLPIHRVPGTKGGTVFAYPSELDAWLRQVPPAKIGETSAATDPTPASQAATIEPIEVPADIHPSIAHRAPWTVSTRKLVGAAFLVGLIAVGTARWVNSNSPAMAAIERVEVKSRSLVALDANNQQLWSFTPPLLAGPGALVPLEAGSTEAFPVDLDADGRREVVALVRPVLKPGFELGVAYAVSASGAMLWKFTPDLAFRFDGTAYNGPWRIRQWLVPSPGEPMWMSFIHQTWWPSFVLTLNRSGQPTLRFVNSGHIETLGRLKTSLGTIVLAGGTNNEYNAAALAVLPEEGAPATSPHGNGLWQVCDTCPRGGPVRYFLFPRSDVNVAIAGERNFVHSLAPYDDGSLDVSVRERYVPFLRAIYHLSSDLTPESVAMSDAYWDAHAQLSDSGVIKHSVDRCPLRREGVTIRVWDGQSGWREVRVPYAFATPPTHN